MAKHKEPADHQVIARNKRAYYEYEIVEDFEAGIALQGSEVKSLRQGGSTIGEAYGRVRDGELFLIDCHIPPFKQANIFNHEPRRPRKLLLHRREIRKIEAQLARKGLTLVPLRLYFNKRGFAKIKLGLGRGKKLHDKRQDMRQKADRRDMDRVRR
jgi:SsrA-binding protein